MSIADAEIINVYTPHTKKVTHIYLKESSAILSTSNDGTLKVTTLCPEFDNMVIEPKEFELTCFTLREQSFNPSKIDFFVGTSLGKLFYFYNGWFNNEKELIHDDRQEGPVTNVVCYKDLVAWSTSSNIRLIHYSRRQKICLIERPK